MKIYTYAIKKSKTIHLWIIESFWLKYLENSGFTPEKIKVDIDSLSISMEAGVSVDKLNEINNYELIKDLDNAVSFIHKCGAVHGDIKPSNIIKCGKVFKLIDFENSNFIGYKYTSAYTNGFRHPQFNYVADTKYDWWAAAATIYFIWCGQFLTIKKRAKLTKLTAGKTEVPLIVTKILEWSDAKSNTKIVVRPIDLYDRFIIYNELCGIFLDEYIINKHKKNINKIINNPFKYPVFRSAQECVLNQYTLTSILEQTNDMQIY